MNLKIDKVLLFLFISYRLIYYSVYLKFFSLQSLKNKVFTVKQLNLKKDPNYPNFIFEFVKSVAWRIGIFNTCLGRSLVTYEYLKTQGYFVVLKIAVSEGKFQNKSSNHQSQVVAHAWVEVGAENKQIFGKYDESSETFDPQYKEIFSMN